MAWCQKNIWDELPKHIGHVSKNKQNSSVNFLVRAEFLTARCINAFFNMVWLLIITKTLSKMADIKMANILFQSFQNFFHQLIF